MISWIIIGIAIALAVALIAWAMLAKDWPEISAMYARGMTTEQIANDRGVWPWLIRAIMRSHLS
jgi:hypothetical protein